MRRCIMGKGGRKRNRPEPAIVSPGDPVGKWRAKFYSRGNVIFQLRDFGPLVRASTPEELREKTTEAIIAATKDKVPN
jgi:hypothetical protein